MSALLSRDDQDKFDEIAMQEDQNTRGKLIYNFFIQI